MEAWLKTGFFENRRYQLSVTDSGLSFVSYSDSVLIPYDELLRLSFVSGNHNTGNFLLGTQKRNYEGYLESEKDVGTLVGLLQEKIDSRFSIDLSIG